MSSSSVDTEKKEKKKRNKSNKKSSSKDDLGTANVSRGAGSFETLRKDKETLQALISTKSKDEQTRIQSHFQGPHAYHAQRRQKLYRSHDSIPANLNPYQQRSLQNRRHRPPNKVVQTQLERHDQHRWQAAIAAADAQVILNGDTDNNNLVEPEHDLERTTRLTQTQLKQHHLTEQTAAHIYNLELPHAAPYGLRYDRSGRRALLYGQSRGHVAVMDCQQRSLQTEFHLNETVRDATFLHDNSLFAVAQRNHVYIYDDTGAEVHHLTDHIDPFHLDYLPYHFLLVSLGRSGYLKYHDISMGTLVSQHRTRLGPATCLRQNPSNAVIHCGHKNGTVTLWSPASSSYLVKLLCHKGSPVTSLAIDRTGHTMVTAGADRQIKIWDLRMLYKERHAYITRGAGIPASVDISQKGILGIAHGVHATFWSPKALHEKQKDPYMYHRVGADAGTLRFRPFEDVCGIGHARGVSSIVIPGSGEPNLDSQEYGTNPNADRKQQREHEIRALLEKLQPDMIAIDPDVVGTAEITEDVHVEYERRRDEEEEKKGREPVKKKQKTKKRGRSKVQTALRRKARNVIDENTMKLREAREQEKLAHQQERQQKQSEGQTEGSNGGAALQETAPTALKRFFS